MGGDRREPSVAASAASTGAKARFPFQLDAALKRRSSTVLQRSVEIPRTVFQGFVSGVCIPQTRLALLIGGNLVKGVTRYIFRYRDVGKGVIVWAIVSHLWYAICYNENIE
jgi:hypothetical protein